MYENFEVCLEKKNNENNEIEINNFTRKSLINKNLYGLSLYEICCKPREIKDVQKINFDFKKIDRIIKETLRCNICLQIYQEPVNMKNCLHKFCKKCIEEYNRRIKKECACCRHPIETRRLLREDNKIKEIINCLIPNIDKFNEVEDQIIKNFLPQFCFKENAISHSHNNTLQNETCIDPLYNPMNDPEFTNLNENLQKCIGRKRIRDINDKDEQNKYEELLNKIDCSLTSSKPDKFKEFEVRLYCDLMNEDMKKSFSKTKIYTKENITLEYFSKYICFKQELKNNFVEKICFLTYDEKGNKICLEKNMTLKQVSELSSNGKDDIVKIHFTFTK